VRIFGLADSEAVRSRRKRLHAAGDHSLCRRCPAVKGRPERGGYSAGDLDVREMPLPPMSMCVAAPVPEFDPAAEMRQLATELHEAYRADTSNGVLARELRMTLRELIGIEGSAVGFDDLAAEYGTA
jgi:hypothetical protein